MTYGALDELACRTAGDLQAMGVAADDRVAVVLDRGPMMASGFLCLAAATVCVPFNPEYTVEELVGLMRRMRVTRLITSVAHHSALEAARRLDLPVALAHADLDGDAGAFSLLFGGPDRPRRQHGPDGEEGLHGGDPPRRNAGSRPGRSVREDDLALVLHTSGSTAAPKIVPLTQANVMASAFHVAESLRLGPDDVCLSALPLFHVGGLVDLLLAPLSRGGTVAMGTGMTGEDFFDDVETFDPTWYQAVPTMLHDVLRSARSRGVGNGAVAAPAGRLRFIRSVSAPLPPTVLAEVEETLRVPVIEMYGMTETAGVITSNPLPPGERRPGSVGIRAGPEVTIVDATGNEAAPGERGEVLVRGASVMSGYERSPAGPAHDSRAGREERDTRPGASLPGGWLRTGDEGWFDADGYLHLTGRIKELINRGGEKVAPKEVDEVVEGHPLVAAAAAFALPHETLGEQVAVAVVGTEEHTPAPGDIIAWCASRLAPYKVPRRVFVVDALPYAPGGKLQRTRLADWCRSERATPRSAEPASTPDAPARGSNGAPATTDRQRLLLRLWREILPPVPFGVNDDFIDLGGDSLSAVELVQRLEDEAGIRVAASVIYDHPTIKRLDDYLERLPDEAPGLVAADVGAMIDEVRSFLSTWQGRRPSPDSLLVGWNTLGGRPPLFFGVQGHGELRDFATRVGSDQPVFGMRSLYGAEHKTERTFAALAEWYVGEILGVRPEGPIHLGGFCAGGALAVQIAERLRARGRDIGSLTLFEHYGDDPLPAEGTCFFNVDSGWHPFADADERWRDGLVRPLHLHPTHLAHDAIMTTPEAIDGVRAAIDGGPRPVGHGDAMDPRSAGRRETTDARESLILRATFPRVLTSRASADVPITIENRGRGVLQAGPVVFDRWERGRAHRRLFDARVTLREDIPPGGRVTERLHVVAPMTPGVWRVTLNAVERGDWREGRVTSASIGTVVVLPGRAVVGYVRRRLPRLWPVAEPNRLPTGDMRP